MYAREITVNLDNPNGKVKYNTVNKYAVFLSILKDSNITLLRNIEDKKNKVNEIK